MAVLEQLSRVVVVVVVAVAAAAVAAAAAAAFDFGFNWKLLELLENYRIFYGWALAKSIVFSQNLSLLRNISSSEAGIKLEIKIYTFNLFSQGVVSFATSTQQFAW